MQTSFFLRLVSLVLFVGLLLSGVSAQAAPRTNGFFDRGRGRVVEHRPNYKRYKGSKLRHHGFLGRAVSKKLSYR